MIIVLAVMITVCLVSLIVAGATSLISLADRIHPIAGTVVFWAVCLAAGFFALYCAIAYARLPAALVPPEEDSGPKHDAYLQALRIRLAANPRTRDLPLVTINPPPNVYNFHSVYGTGPDDVYVGAELQGLVPPPAPALHAGGAIFRWDGQAWTPVFTDPVSDVLSVWRANDHEGYATGDFASVVRNASADGGWVRIFDISNLPMRVSSVWGSSMKNVFIVGDDGTIVRYSP